MMMMMVMMMMAMMMMMMMMMMTMGFLLSTFVEVGVAGMIQKV
jgi:hypothetical protein